MLTVPNERRKLLAKKYHSLPVNEDEEPKRMVKVSIAAQTPVQDLAK